MAMQNNRTKSGKFTSEGLKGNQYAKKDWTKEMAIHVTSQELHWTAKMLSTPVKVLKRMQKDGTLGDESLFTYSILSKAIKGDFIPAKFLIEMLLGKAPQQINTTSVNENNNKITLNYKLKPKDENAESESESTESKK